MRLFLKPSKPGLIVRDPRSKQPLPAEGAYKPDTSYWRRRLRSKEPGQADVIEATPPSSAATPAPAAPQPRRRAEG